MLQRGPAENFVEHLLPGRMWKRIEGVEKLLRSDDYEPSLHRLWLAIGVSMPLGKNNTSGGQPEARGHHPKERASESGWAVLRGGRGALPLGQ